MAFGAYNAPFSTTAYLSGSRSRYKRLSRYPHISHVPKRLYQRLTLWKLIVCTTGLIYLFAVCTVYSPDKSLISVIANALSPAAARASITKDQFVAAILRNPVEGLLDPEPIRKLCLKTKFQDGLVWHCATVFGGVGKVDNMLLNCVRYAIEAGATTLILPRLGIPSDNIDVGNDQRSDELSRLFDVSYFLESWEQVCPKIRAVVSESEVAGLTPAEISPRYDPVDAKPFEMRNHLIVDPTGWRETFDHWMAENEIFKNMTAENPVRVWQNPVFSQWNRKFHSPAFANSFPRLFRYPSQTRQLAASGLWNLEQKLGRSVVSNTIVLTPLSASSRVNSLSRSRLATNGFFGAQLQVTANEARAGASDYDAQASFYIAEAKRLNMSTIYVAMDSEEEYRERFREDAANQDMDVLFKESIFGEEELSELTRLPWYQQQLVDYNILLYSSWFYGSAQSDFTWSLAIRRGTLPEAGIPEEPDAEPKNQQWRDNLSIVKGQRNNINSEGIWP